jgi:hypothetical protein
MLIMCSGGFLVILELGYLTFVGSFTLLITERANRFDILTD